MASLSGFRVLSTRCSSRSVMASSSLRLPLALQQKRTMALGGHHGPPPDWQGVDKVVRGYFPHDYQCTFLYIDSYYL
jgi:hypothetical protein